MYSNISVRNHLEQCKIDALYVGWDSGVKAKTSRKKIRIISDDLIVMGNSSQANGERVKDTLDIANQLPLALSDKATAKERLIAMRVARKMFVKKGGRRWSPDSLKLTAKYRAGQCGEVAAQNLARGSLALPKDIDAIRISHPQMDHAFVVYGAWEDFVSGNTDKLIWSDPWLLGPTANLMSAVSDGLRFDNFSGLFNAGRGSVEKVDPVTRKVVARKMMTTRVSGGLGKEWAQAIEYIDSMADGDRISSEDVVGFGSSQARRMQGYLRMNMYGGANRITRPRSRDVFVGVNSGDEFVPGKFPLNRHFDERCKILLTDWYEALSEQARQSVEKFPYKNGFDFVSALAKLCNGDTSEIMFMLDPLPPEVASRLVLELIQLGILKTGRGLAFEVFFRNCVNSEHTEGRVDFLCQLTDHLRRVPDVFPWAKDVMGAVCGELVGGSVAIPASWHVLQDPAQLMADAICDNQLTSLAWVAKLNEQWPWMVTNGDLAHALHCAAANASDAAADLLMSLPATAIDSPDGDGLTALGHAARAGATKIAEQLIARGADVEAVSKDGNSVLGTAATEGSMDMISLLLKHEAGVNLAPPPARRTALMQAAQAGHGAIVRMLLLAKALPQIEDVEGNTALSLAVVGGNELAVSLLLSSRETFIDHKNQEGVTPLMFAVGVKNYDVVNLLLGLGADPHLENDQGVSCVTMAMEGGDNAIANLVMERALDCGDASGRNLLILAAMNGDAGLVDELLAVNEDAVFWKDVKGWDPLFHACSAGYVSVVESLVAIEGLPLDLHVGTRSTPLIAAIIGGHIDVVEALLTNGANPDRANRIGETPAIIAASNGNLSVLTALLNRRANPNAAGQKGYTPLMIAAMNGHVGCVDLLLRSGADTTARNAEGKSALDLAKGEAKSMLEEGPPSI